MEITTQETIAIAIGGVVIPGVIAAMVFGIGLTFLLLWIMHLIIDR